MSYLTTICREDFGNGLILEVRIYADARVELFENGVYIRSYTHGTLPAIPVTDNSNSSILRESGKTGAAVWYPQRGQIGTKTI